MSRQTAKLCIAKFAVLLLLAAAQILMTTGVYYISAAISSGTQDYNFILPPLFVLKEIGRIFLSAIPMIAFFWMLSVCIQTPIFSIGIGLASIVPSVLMINTKIWQVCLVVNNLYAIAGIGFLAMMIIPKIMGWGELL